MLSPLAKSFGKLTTAVALIILERKINIPFSGSLSTFESWLLSQTIFYFLIPLLIMGEEGIKLIKNSPKASLKYASIMLAAAFPIMVFASSLSAFNQYYPIDYAARLSAANFLRHELLILGIMLNTEFFFRGFLLFTLRDFFKNIKSISMEKAEKLAIAAHAVPYMLVHIGKPSLEVPYSFFAGIVFGFADVKAGSILPSFIAHFVSSVIFDLLAIINTMG